MDKQERLGELMAMGPAIPVITIEEREQAVPLAKALVAGGLRVLEVTLRTAVALAAIREIADAVPEAVVGAGTILTGAQLEAASRAGAVFAVSPGATAALLLAARDSPLPLLPGAATASEMMLLLERGYRHLKFFPAEPAGGVAFLRSIVAPLPELRFCPTGGIGPANAPDYLALANVACIGGSWMVPRAAVGSADWPRVTELARGAAGLAGGAPP